MSCLFHLPFTELSLNTPNKLVERMWGRCELSGMYAMLNFRSGDISQSILHEIKYSGNQELCKQMGILLGERLLDQFKLLSDPVLIPVPLHPKKFKIRGFNQSLVLASAIGLTTNVAVEANILRRIEHKSSLTAMDRFQRSKALEGLYKGFRIEDLRQRPIILVDDVITSGATTVACLSALQNIYKRNEYYLVTLAVAQ